MNKQNINKRLYLRSLLVIAILMVFCYLLSFIIPSGSFERIVNESGNTIINTGGSYTPAEGNLTFVKFILAPFLVLGSEGNITLIGVIVFILAIGGAFNALDKSGIMQYMLDKITDRYEMHKYTFLKAIILMFMAMGALIGSFEEVVPMVPICVALAEKFGWNKFTGISMSLLAVGCGFATGVFNPFTVGVAQSIAQVPLFSGVSMRAVSFVVIYLILTAFVISYARKNERHLSQYDHPFFMDMKLEKGLSFFIWSISIGVAVILSSSFITFLQDYTTIIVALVFLSAGIFSPIVAGRSEKLGKHFLDGIISIIPAAAMILMASSVRFILEEAKVLDTILYFAINIAKGLDKWIVVLFIYLIVLIMNFFIASGSAKAFMLIPLIVPLANAFGISTQLCILAYAFGDGFSNVFYATNPALLISLSLSKCSYKDWVKYSLPFQLINLLVTSLLLIGAMYIGY